MAEFIEGELFLTDAKIAVIVARSYLVIVETLLTETVDALRRSGVHESDVTIIRVPGVFEIPVVAERLAKTGNHDGLLALGAVIGNDTPESDCLAAVCSKGLAAVSLEYSMPIGFGILISDTPEQAIESLSNGSVNKGTEAVLTLLEMVNILHKLSEN